MAPASEIILACSASASVSVDLPASGCEITAKVRRLDTSAGSPREPDETPSVEAVNSSNLSG
jgi:hypothetical protein